MKRKLVLMLTGTILTVIVCRCGGSASATAFSCTATGTLVDPNNASSPVTSVSVVLTGANDTGPFSVTIGGVANSMTTTAQTFSVPATANVIAGGIVSVTDTADTAYVTSCTITTNGLTTGTYPYGTPTPVGGGYYYPGGTFTCPGATTSGTTSVTCQLDRASGVFYVGDTIVYNVLSSTGEKIYLSAWDPGEPWDGTPPTFPMQTPVAISYSQPGPKHLQFCGVSATRANVLCNGGQPMLDDISINARY